jgi:Putative beta barrel porin-7 (BBP7)
MRKGLLLTFGTLLTNAGFALAQTLPISTATVPTALLSPAAEAISTAPAAPEAASAPAAAAPAAPELAPAPAAAAAPVAAPDAAKPMAPAAEIKPMLPTMPALPTLGSLPPHSGSCDGCNPCLPCKEEEKKRGPKCWVDAEYLMWWFKDAPLPVPLIAFGSPTDLPPGALGQPGTVPLFGPTGQNLGTFSGGRITVGGWFNEASTIGFEASGFLLETRSRSFLAASDPTGNPVLALPFFDATTNAENGFLTSFPGFFTGGILVSSTAQLWGAEANGLFRPLKGDNFSIGLLGGFRYLDLRERLDISSSSVSLVPGVPPIAGPAGSTFDAADSFATRNQFYGGQLGIKAEAHMSRFFASLTGKCALGQMHESVSVNGVTSFGGAVPPAVFPGGIFTAGSNIGQRTSDRFAVVPEAQVQVGVDVTSNIRAFVGYNFLYVSDVVRPGDQIDRSFNFTQVAPPLGPGALVGPAVPTAQFNHTDFWAHGVNFGIEFRF